MAATYASNIETLSPVDFSPVSYGWSLSSATSSKNGPVDTSDFLVESPEISTLVQTNDTPLDGESFLTQTTFNGNLSSFSLGNDFASGNISLDYASSEHSDDLWTKDGPVSDLADMLSSTASPSLNGMDRRHRRREQNRKAQSNFRQKRKEEVRRLEREVEQLRAQVADFHKKGPTASLTICTSCRNFFPASTEDDMDFFGKAQI